MPRGARLHDYKKCPHQCGATIYASTVALHWRYQCLKNPKRIEPLRKRARRDAPALAHDADQVAEDPSGAYENEDFVGFGFDVHAGAADDDEVAARGASGGAVDHAPAVAPAPTFATAAAVAPALAQTVAAVQALPGMLQPAAQVESSKLQLRYTKQIRLLAKRANRVNLTQALFAEGRYSNGDAQRVLDAIASSKLGRAYLEEETSHVAKAESMRKDLKRVVELWAATLNEGVGGEARARGRFSYARVQHSTPPLSRLATVRAAERQRPLRPARSVHMPLKMQVTSLLRDPLFFNPEFGRAYVDFIRGGYGPWPRDVSDHVLFRAPALVRMAIAAKAHFDSYDPSARQSAADGVIQRVFLPIPVVVSADGVSLDRGMKAANNKDIVSFMCLLSDPNTRRQPQYVRALASMTGLVVNEGKDDSTWRRRVVYQKQLAYVVDQFVSAFREPWLLRGVPGFEQVTLVAVPLLVALLADHPALAGLCTCSAAVCTICSVQKADLGRVLDNPAPTRLVAEVRAARAAATAAHAERESGKHKSSAEHAADTELRRLGVHPETAAFEVLEDLYMEKGLLDEHGFWSRHLLAILHGVYLGPVKDQCILIVELLKQNGTLSVAINRVSQFRTFFDGYCRIPRHTSFEDSIGKIPGAEYRDMLLHLYLAIGDVPGLLADIDHEPIVRAVETTLRFVSLVRRTGLSDTEHDELVALGRDLVTRVTSAFDGAERLRLNNGKDPRWERPKLHKLAHELRSLIDDFGSPAEYLEAVFESSYKNLKQLYVMTQKTYDSDRQIFNRMSWQLWSDSEGWRLRAGATTRDPLPGTRPVFGADDPHTCAAVGFALTWSKAVGCLPIETAAIRRAWRTYFDGSTGEEKRAYFSGDILELDKFGDKHGAELHFSAWVHNPREGMHGTVRAIPAAAPTGARAASGFEEAKEDGYEQFDFVVVGSSRPRRLAQLCAIFTVPTRTVGRERSPMVLVRYLTNPLGAPNRAGAITLDYAERRFYSSEQGKAQTDAAKPLFYVEALDVVVRSWPVFVRYEGTDEVAPRGFITPSTL